MEQIHTALDMLDLMVQPAFCVRDNHIIKVNSAAAGLLIEQGSEIQPLLFTGIEEYAAFSSGCLYLTLSIAGNKIGASVTRMQDFDVFSLEQDEEQARLQTLALAARELRGPLSNVMTVADQLFPLPNIAENGENNEQLSRINRGIYQMLRIISNMSDAGRFVADNGARQEIRNICAILGEIFHQAEVLCSEAGVSLCYTGYPESVYTLADAQKLERMVFNILSNAIKFTPKGGSISANLARRRNKLYLSVSDNGDGIPEALRGQVFSRYTRDVAPEDGRCGLGLGMVLIRSVAAAHGGTVLVDQPEECSTRITVSLAIRHTDSTVRSPRLHVDYAGERNRALIELAEILPPHLYDPKSVN